MSKGAARVLFRFAKNKVVTTIILRTNNGSGSRCGFPEFNSPFDSVKSLLEISLFYPNYFQEVTS